MMSGLPQDMTSESISATAWPCPMPGPIAMQLHQSIRLSSCDLSKVVQQSAVPTEVMASGRHVRRIAAAPAAVKTFKSPAPLRSAARVDIIAAPVRSSLPAIKSALPLQPL